MSPAATTSFLPLAPVETVCPFLHPGATSFLPAHDRFILQISSYAPPHRLRHVHSVTNPAPTPVQWVASNCHRPRRTRSPLELPCTRLSVTTSRVRAGQELEPFTAKPLSSQTAASVESYVLEAGSMERSEPRRTSCLTSMSKASISLSSTVSSPSGKTATEHMCAFHACPSLRHGKSPVARRVASREHEYPQPHNGLGPSFILSTTTSSQR